MQACQLCSKLKTEVCMLVNHTNIFVKIKAVYICMNHSNKSELKLTDKTGFVNFNIIY